MFVKAVSITLNFIRVITTRQTYFQGSQQTSPFSSQNERKNVQQNPISSSSQQAVSEPVTTTPSSVDLPPSGTITP